MASPASMGGILQPAGRPFADHGQPFAIIPAKRLARDRAPQVIPVSPGGFSGQFLCAAARLGAQRRPGQRGERRDGRDEPDESAKLQLTLTRDDPPPGLKMTATDTSRRLAAATTASSWS